MGELLFNKYGVWEGKMSYVMDGSDGCVTLRMCLIPNHWKLHLKMVNMIRFYVVCFSIIKICLKMQVTDLKKAHFFILIHGY